jgi:ABC-type nitrate/sulfonate/bicarbonate transport system substrate-binding protein
MLSIRAAVAPVVRPLAGATRFAIDAGLLEETSHAYPSICIAPGQIAEALLRAEGFIDVRYVESLADQDAIARGEIDFSMQTAAWVVAQVDGGSPVTALAGVHPGCFERFAHEPIQTVSDLKGKRVGIPYTEGSVHLLLVIMAAQVGLDPHQDIDWVTPGPTGTAMQLFAERQVDAILGFPPEPQELRARKIGRVILNITTDKPWSQHLCCICVRQQGLCPRSSGRHQTLPTCHPQGRRSLRRRAGDRRATAGRGRVHRALRLCAPDADRTAVRQLARVRPGGLDAVLRAAPPRGRHD